MNLLSKLNFSQQRNNTDNNIMENLDFFGKENSSLNINNSRMQQSANQGTKSVNSKIKNEKSVVQSLQNNGNNLFENVPQDKNMLIRNLSLQESEVNKENHDFVNIQRNKNCLEDQSNLTSDLVNKKCFQNWNTLKI